jgi:outer membrane receptor protein involved in Fe transport
MVCVVGLFAVNGFAQQLAAKTVEERMLNQPLESFMPLGEALSKLGIVFDVHIVYDDTVVRGKTVPISYLASTSGKNFQEALEMILKETPIAYKKVGARTIVLQPAEPPPAPPLPATTGTIKGKVTDEQGQGIPLAQVFIEGTTMGDAADQKGEYVIENVPPGTYTLQTRVIGYRTKTVEVTVSVDATVTQDFVLAVDVLSMEEIVVSGTPGGAGTTKRDASFAVTTIDVADIQRSAPSSTANLLELVPGVWPESSGGVAGANIFVRGMPSAGDAPFVTMSINGAPLYGTETLSFFEQSTIFRIDETVEAVESQRGGPSSVFSNAEPGMTVNFNLKRGSDVTQGRVKYSTSDYNLQRVDAVLSGDLIAGLYYMVGGYVLTSPGVRSTEFNAENGKQLTLQLTKLFDNGSLNAFTRVTNDNGQWVLPMALNTGNDLGTFAQLGNATRFRELQINDEGDTRIFDFANGRGWKGSISGINASFDLGDGWTVRDNLSYTSGEANTFGFVPNGSPVRVSTFLNAFGAELGLTSLQTRGGRTLSGSDFIQNYGHWVVLKDLESITNDISLNKVWKDHNLTLGSYQARWSADDFWTLGNAIPVHNVENGDRVQEEVTAQHLTSLGGGDFAFGLQSAGDARTVAIYGADSWQVSEPLRIDLGLRYEWFDLQYTLDTGPGFPDGSTDRADSFDGRDFAVTAAVNYDFTKKLGVFGRFTDGYLFPHFDNIREDNFGLEDGRLDANDFKQGEVGVKFDSDRFSIFATGFINRVDVFDSDVGSVRDPARLETQTFGVELDGGFSYRNFTLKAVATLQDGEIKDATAAARDDIGNSIWRQPDWQVRVSPSYNFPLNKFNATLYGTLRSVGKRWDSRTNVFELDSYTKIDLGIMLVTPGRLLFNIHADNLNDSEGLTEGDPRDPAAANGRPIFGRSVKFSVSYDF